MSSSIPSPPRRFDPFAALARGLARLTAVSVTRPWTVLAVALALFAASGGWAAGHLALKTSNLDLIAPDLPEVAAFRAFAEEFGTPNSLIVVLAGEDRTSLARAVDRLVPALAGAPGVRSVLGRLPGNPDSPVWRRIDPYFASRDRKLFFLFVQPDDPESSAATIGPFVAGVRGVLEAADLPATGIRFGTTGLPQYALDDRDVVQRDITLLSGLSFLLVLGLFVAAFAEWVRPLAAMATLLAAVGVVLGLAAIYPGHLTLLSSFFGSILFGLGVDYGIHVVDRTEEMLAEGRPKTAAVLAAGTAVAPGLATGALTTATAFFCLAASGFRGFAELGAIAGAGVLLCLVAMMTVLPALLVVLPAGRRRERPVTERRIGRLLLRLQSPALALALAAAAALAPLAGGPGFDADYLDLEPAGSEAVRLEREMVARSGLSPQFAAFVAPDRAAAAALVAKLRGEETVGDVHWAGEEEMLAWATGASATDRAGFRERFVSPQGRYAVYAYPKGDVWDPAFRDRFLAAMRAHDGRATGMPFLGKVMIDRSQRALLVGALLASLAIVFWVWADFRSLRWTAVAVLPTFLTVASLRGLMKLFAIPFNPLDVMALPVVIGIAVDNGVHLVHRFREEGGDLARTLAGTGRSVVMTSATTIASFGVLGFAAHRGLASFAWALTLGVTLALVLSVLVLPQALVRLRPWLLGGRGAGAERRRRPLVAAALALATGTAAGLAGSVPLRAQEAPPEVPAPREIAEPLPAPSAQERGDAAWAARGDAFLATGTVDPAPAAAAIAAWEEALAADPGSMRLRAKLAEALYFLGHFATADPGERRRLVDRQLAVAREGLERVEARHGDPAELAALAPGARAARLAGDPEAVPAHFWAAISWGVWGMEHGVLAAAGQNVAGRVRDHAEVVRLLDETYAEAGGLRLSGRLHTVTPRLVLFTPWIDRRLGVERLRRACEISRADPRNPLFLAEALLAHEPAARAEAVELLRAVASRPPDPAQVVEQSEMAEQARQALGRLGEAPPEPERLAASPAPPVANAPRPETPGENPEAPAEVAGALAASPSERR